jgi:hypothetical protein
MHAPRVLAVAHAHHTRAVARIRIRTRARRAREARPASRVQEVSLVVLEAHPEVAREKDWEGTVPWPRRPRGVGDGSEAEPSREIP